jgi:serpin B
MGMFVPPIAWAASEEARAEGQGAAAVDAFAVDVYRRLAQEEGNLFFSPYSIASALTMTYAGAKGATAEEMEKALHFSETGPEFHASEFHASMKALQDRFATIPEGAGEFDTANRLWLDKKTKLLPDYLTLVQENYGGGVEQVNFLGDAEDARKTINDWVAQKTRDKIRDLLRQGDVTSATRLVLTNAVYFNSAWREPFMEDLTKEEPFYMDKDRRKNVPMMRRNDFFLYGEEPGLQLLKIPYRIPGFSLLILLPRENESFTQMEELEKGLTSQALAAWTAGMKRREVRLRLPKFKNEGRYLLKGVLQKLGVKLAFTEDADFSGMTVKGEEGICIDSVVHQSFIELDEKGTEAAAATAVVARVTSTGLSDRKEPVDFHADRPFIYCLTDDVSGTILFMGRLVEP